MLHREQFYRVAALLEKLRRSAPLSLCRSNRVWKTTSSVALPSRHGDGRCTPYCFFWASTLHSSFRWESW
jgi:hypothetical protein